MEKYPVYELLIDENAESFVDAIALVDSPAIESDFLAFSKEQSELKFQVNEEKMELLGAAMIPDQLIYREGPQGGYNVFFKKQTIREIAQVYMKRGLQTNLNLDHTEADAKSFVFQSYIVDSSMGMASPKNLDLVDGSWVVGVKVTDKQVWEEIKAGKRKGFSVEGLFQLIKSDFNINYSMEETEVMDILKDISKLLSKTK